MADKITLSNVGSLIDTTTAQTTINDNFATIQTAFDNNLSRDGTSPNQMMSNLDMNSNQILNLPSPASMDSPARLVDVVTNPTITVPPVGTSGATVGLLNANKTDSGNNIFNGTETFNGNVTFTGSVSGLPAPPSAGWLNNYSSKTSTYTVQSSDNGSTIGLSGNTFFTVTFATAANYPANFVCMVANEEIYTGPGTARGKFIQLPNGSIMLYPGQNVLVFVRNATSPIFDWHPKTQRWRTATPTFFVDTAGNDANDGLVTGSGALATFQAAASACYYNCDSAGTSPTILGTSGQTFAQQLNLGGVPFGTNLLTISSSSTAPFNWQQPAGGGSILSVGDHSQVALSNVAFNHSGNNVFGQAACYLHNDGLIDFGPNISFIGGGNVDSAIFLDNNDCIMTVANGFTCSNTFGDLIHFDGGGAATISGSISPSGATVVGEFIHLKAKARAIFGTQPVTTGYTSIGTSVVEQQSLLILQGITIPGGTSTATGGLII